LSTVVTKTTRPSIPGKEVDPLGELVNVPNEEQPTPALAAPAFVRSGRVDQPKHD
jgi:hypothetical protein